METPVHSRLSSLSRPKMDFLIVRQHGHLLQCWTDCATRDIMQLTFCTRPLLSHSTRLAPNSIWTHLWHWRVISILTRNWPWNGWNQSLKKTLHLDLFTQEKSTRLTPFDIIVYFLEKKGDKLQDFTERFYAQNAQSPTQGHQRFQVYGCKKLNNCK